MVLSKKELGIGKSFSYVGEYKKGKWQKINGFSN